MSLSLTKALFGEDSKAQMTEAQVMKACDAIIAEGTMLNEAGDPGMLSRMGSKVGRLLSRGGRFAGRILKRLIKAFGADVVKQAIPYMVSDPKQQEMLSNAVSRIDAVIKGEQDPGGIPAPTPEPAADADEEERTQKNESEATSEQLAEASARWLEMAGLDDGKMRRELMTEIMDVMPGPPSNSGSNRQVRMNIPGGEHEMIDMPAKADYEVYLGTVRAMNIAGDPDPMAVVQVRPLAGRSVGSWMSTDQIESLGADALGLSQAEFDDLVAEMNDAASQGSY